MGLWLLWLCWVRLGATEEETLLNTRLATSDLQWTVYPPGEGQWEELSALDEELQAPVRTFEVCSWLGPPGPPQNSWLRSGWVPRRGATHVYAELRFTLLACDSLPRPRARARRAPRRPPPRHPRAERPNHPRGDPGDGSSGGRPDDPRPDRPTDHPRGERPTDPCRDPRDGSRGDHPPRPCRDRPSDPRPDQAAPGDGHEGHQEEPGDAPWDLGTLPGVQSHLGSALGERFGHQTALGDGPGGHQAARDGHQAGPGGHHEAAGGHQAPPEPPPAPLSSATGAQPSAAAFPTPLPGAHRDRGRRSRRSFPPRRCKETFNVFYHESDADTATALSPPWLENPYVKVDTVAAEHLSRRPPPAGTGGAGAAGRPSGKVNLKTLRLGPLRRAGFYLALQDLGACLALLSVRLFLRRCPAATALLASFPPTLPSELLTPARGRCLRGAVQLGGSPPLMYCREDGRWAEPPTHGCACGPGHQHDPGGGGGCRACPPDSYKAEVGEGLCQPCPPLSQAPGPGASLCGCRPGFYRAPGEGPELRCSAPPSAPRSLRALMNGSEVRLEWSSPAQGGSRQDLSFRVGCRECPQAGGAAGGSGPCGPCRGLSFEPGAGELRGRGVSVRGLRPGVAYGFSVTAHSGVSALSPLPPPAASINVSVGHVPPPVADVARVGGTPTGVTLAWPSPPPGPPAGDPILDYEVKYYEKVGGGEGPPMFLKVPLARAELGGLRRGGVYGVRVRARSQAGYGEFGPEVTISPPAAEGSRGGPEGVVAGAAVLGGVLVLALLGGSLLCLRRRRHRSREDTDQAEPGEQGRKFYIDPLSYEDPGVALRDLAPEIDPSWVTIEEVIGAGEFGEVCRASLALPGAPPLPVAVKTLKGGAGEGQLRDFLREAARMAPLRHRHVVRLQGVVSAAGSAMILTEYMENGALDAFLRARVGALGTLQLVGLLRGVAAGMRYLADAGFVHRDLAARNVLLDAHLVPKVSDFGLARALQGPACADPTYTSCMGGKIPIRWTAPEAIAWRQFTSASDVWSYGIVMWEVMAFGERPYWDMSNQDVLNAIEQDYRLPPPAGCPAPLHRLMLACWRRHRSLRPRFAALLRALDRLMRDPCALRRPAASPPSPPQLAQLSPTEAPGPPAAPWDSVGEWLRGLLPGPPEETPSTSTSDRDLLPRDLLSLGLPLAGQQQTLDCAQSPPKGDPPF